MTDQIASPAHQPRRVVAVGLATIVKATGAVLDTTYPSPQVGGADLASTVGLTASGTVRLAHAKASELGGSSLAGAAGTDQARGVDVVPVLTLIDDLDAAPIDAHDAYLRLQLLSHRVVRPHELNLDGLFGILENVVWTSQGPCAVEGFESVRLALRAAGRNVNVTSIDKFPRMTDYVVPSGVRIADADRVRLGAHLAPGTTVMHEGFVNFNAGTLGASMVEGRISAGVIVGDGTDIGGGASIMGTLSGGGKNVISLGERCLLGANSGLGISLGDDCVVEAGLYVTAGTIVTLPDGKTAKARDLSGESGVLLRRNSLTGAVEAQPRSGGSWGGLNADLHAN